MSLFWEHFLPPEVRTYIEQNASPEDPILREIREWTQKNTELPIMLTGHPYHVLLEILCRIRKPQTALEVGTFTGYATVTLARALPPEGILVSIERDLRLQKPILEHLRKAGVLDRVRIFWGDALEVLPVLPYRYDFVFLDATKREYQPILELLIPRLEREALIVIDNTLWEGSVHDPEERKRDENARYVHELNRWLAGDPRFRTMILPFRDGVTLALYLGPAKSQP